MLSCLSLLLLMFCGGQHRAGVFAGAELIWVGSPGAEMVCGGPVEPRFQEGRQRPKPSGVVGLEVCGFGYCTQLRPGPVTSMGTEPSESACTGLTPRGRQTGLRACVPGVRCCSS